MSWARKPATALFGNTLATNALGLRIQASASSSSGRRHSMPKMMNSLCSAVRVACKTPKLRQN